MKLKTIKLKGKAYVQVDTRVTYFNDTFENGKIETEATFQGEDTVYFKATITPDAKFPDRKFTGHSFGKIGAEKALEKLETVAVGRALAFMGIGIVDGIASAEEMDKFYQSEKNTLEEQCELAKQGKLMCFDCGSDIQYSETKTGEARLKCPKDWKHKNFISKDKVHTEANKIANVPF